MPRHICFARHRSVPTVIATVLTCCTVLAGALASPGAANTTGSAAADSPLGHPGADHMGSGIKRHRNVAVTDRPLDDGLPGLDVSAYQGDVDWNSVKSNGAAFAYVKATEGTYYQSPNYQQQFSGSADAGLIRGAYHFAIPNDSSGAQQADYFADNGGGWSADGKTLPGMLDIEYNPNGDTCYGLSQGDMVAWIHDFADEYAKRTGRPPTIYSTTDWWTQCTGNDGGFAQDPLDIANYSASPDPLPAGWTSYTFWQYADAGTFPGDQDVFNGTADQLLAFAKNTGASQHRK